MNWMRKLWFFIFENGSTTGWKISIRTKTSIEKLNQERTNVSKELTELKFELASQKETINIVFNEKLEIDQKCEDLNRITLW